MGYKNITMGGMVPLKTAQILETLEEIKPLLKSDTRVHLLGIARPESFTDFIRLGVTSIDSTTPFSRRLKIARITTIRLRDGLIQLCVCRSSMPTLVSVVR